ncbi:MAG: deoxyribodipyrimidine photo-lyase [Actinomycetota bacterium]|nr:deoxyribodipyrimidine photo-lyase [Actinomycetota bacterium]
MTVTVALFTRDLRVRDNPVLAAAVAAADAVIPLFVFDDAILATSHGSPNRVGFLIQALADLDASLQDRGGALAVRHGDWVGEVVRLVEETGAISVHVARDVSAFAQQRAARLAEHVPVPVVFHDALAVVAPGTFKPYQVFTPYWNKWSDTAWRQPVPMVRRLIIPPDFDRGALPGSPAHRAPDVMRGGETEGLRRMKAWTARTLARYAEVHDDVAADATSRISPYLHFGCLSPLEVATRLRGRAGGEAFVRQLCWRDFFMQFLAARPDTAHRSVRREPEWIDDDEGLAAWQQGTTGFPLVDAGMRQLAREGFVHNRVRMVVASFLTKDLLVDWRTGAAFFMQHLVDGDLAVNQLNWQWVAGTGTDTNPHRVYNPTLQAQKFDPAGTYIRRYVDELRDVHAPDVHDPPPEVREKVGYPPPMVDHKAAIERRRARRAS